MSYEIGYGKPPVHSRYRKGQSGNPGGRPGPRRAAEWEVQAELEELLFLSPGEFASSASRDGFGGIAAALTRDAAGGDAAAVRLLFSFVSERGRKRPRRARLPTRIKQKLDRAMSERNPEAVGGKRQTQGITPAHWAPVPAAAGCSRGDTKKAEARRPRLPAMRNLRELRGARKRGCASQGITCRRPAAQYDLHKDMEGAGLRCSQYLPVHILREIHDIRGPPLPCIIGNAVHSSPAGPL